MLTNHEGAAHTYSLAASGPVDVDLPASVTVAPRETRAITVTSMTAGPQPFTVAAAAEGGATASADAVVDVTATTQAALRLTPDPLVAGLGSTSVFTLAVTNLGDRVATFDLAAELPPGWSYAIQNSSGAVQQVTLFRPSSSTGWNWRCS